MSVAAVVPAAGSGSRLGAALPKAFVPLAGVPIVVRAVDGLLGSGVVDTVIVAVPESMVEQAKTLLYGRPVDVLTGGADRTSSVAVALQAQRVVGGKGAGDGIVLVHDAARPLTPPALIRSVVDAVRSGREAVVPVLPVPDTIKRVDAEGAVTGTVDRSALRRVQTPQGFTAALLHRAYASAGAAATDDAGLVEAIGARVWTVPGDPLAFKVTTGWDFRIAELLLREAEG